MSRIYNFFGNFERQLFIERRECKLDENKEVDQSEVVDSEIMYAESFPTDEELEERKKAGRELGKRSAEVRKKKGHGSKYYSELAKKRWQKG